MRGEWDGNERRKENRLSEHDIEAIAKRASEIFKRDAYASLGEGVASKGLYVLGLGLIALAGWLAGKGHLPFGGE